MSRPVEVLLDLLFPPRCVFCTKLLDTGEHDLCSRCQRELPWLTGHPAEQQGDFFSLCVSPLYYQDQVKESIRRYKFHGRRGYHKAYGTFVAQCITDHLAGRYDLMTWVPLSRRRKRERGYDQSFLLASAAAQALGNMVVETLRKDRDTPAQSGLEDAAQRRANVLGVYSPVNPGLVAGKRVLLVDDVITTGSTLSECARILRTAGASDVVCATVARAG